MNKEKIVQRVESLRANLLELSHKIHSNPETGGKEFQAVKWQVEMLTKEGFVCETPYCGMETAYRAVYKGKGNGPVIAFLSEYDALEGLGHGCGHNLMAASAVGAAIGFKDSLGDQAGEIRVYGTPAEETWGGKIPMVEQGAFRDVDFGLMFHPSTDNIINRQGKACVGVKAKFIGKSAHSSRPETGINALTALIGLFNRTFSQLEIWPAGARCNGIVINGGTASNIITEEAEGDFLLRAHTLKDLQIMSEDFKVLAQEAADEVGATVSMVWEPAFAERYTNRAMGMAFLENMALLGEKMNLPNPAEQVGSSDVGNVSLVIPVIHEYLKIAEPTVNGHSKEFREASVSERGDEVVLLAAKGLAMTAYDLFTNPELQTEVKEEFKRVVPQEYQEMFK